MFSSFSISHTESDVRAEARRQLSVVLIISFLPLILGFIVVASAGESPSFSSSWDAFSSVFLQGELYFYATATCAQIYYMSSYIEKRGIRGMRLDSGVFVIICVALMSLYIGLGSPPNTVLHGVLSVLLLIAAVIINYRVIVISQQPPPMPEDVNRQHVGVLEKSLDPNYD